MFRKTQNDEIQCVQRKVKKLLVSIIRSPKAVETLKTATGGIGIIKPCKTRWIYWYYVYDRLLKIKRHASLYRIYVFKFQIHVLVF